MSSRRFSRFSPLSASGWPGRRQPRRRRLTLTRGKNTIDLKRVFRLDVDLAPPLEIMDRPNGNRRVIRITGGRFHGERLNGKIIVGGAD